MPTEFKLPEVSEGVESADIAEILVAEGDTIESGQAVMEVETDKAVVELPCPHNGTVSKIHVSPGDTVEIGALLLTIEEGAAAPAKQEEQKAESARESAPSKEAEAAKSEEQSASTPVATTTAQRAENPSPFSEDPHAPHEATQTTTALARGNGHDGPPPPAAPSTRRLARELNVDLHRVQGSGAGGRITKDDVKSFVRTLTVAPNVGDISVPMGGGSGAMSLPAFEKFGPVTRQPMNKIARTSANHLSLSWQMIPHVTQHDLADITDMEAARKAFMAGAGKNGPKVTMTAIVIKASVAALKLFPHVNSSLDPNTFDLILKDYYHIGCAVDTPHGLVVPVLRDCDRKSILEIAAELIEISAKARERKLGMDDMQGGTFTITNLGGIGGTSFTPIVNYPEVAIMGLSRGRKQLQIVDGEIQERMLLPMSLSYDHRVINGADAARFMVTVSRTMSDFMSLLVQC